MVEPIVDNTYHPSKSVQQGVQIIKLRLWIYDEM